MIAESVGRRRASTNRKFRIKGISTGGAAARDQFAIPPAGVSLEPIREAVVAFIRSLGCDQREPVSGAFDPVTPSHLHIYSPVIIIEFYHAPGIALPNTGYSRSHGHALVWSSIGNVDG